MTTTWRAVFVLAAASLSVQAAQFDFATLIRLGSNSGGSANWELAAGNSAGTWAVTGNLTPWFATTSDRLFQISYTQSTNTATLQVFKGTSATGPSDSVSFNPTGGSAIQPTAIWTLPASAFFVQALPELTLATVAVSNLALVTGTILAPLQTTPLTVTNTLTLGAGTVFANSDVTFVGNSSGNWQLQGILSMTATGLPSSNGLQFGLTAIATNTPEPMTSLMIGLGLLGVSRWGRVMGGKVVMAKVNQWESKQNKLPTPH